MPEVRAKDVQVEKTWHAVCNLCIWVSVNCVTYQEANGLRLIHLEEHRKEANSA